MMQPKQLLIVGVLLITVGVAVGYSKIQAHTTRPVGEFYDVREVHDGDTLEILRYGKLEKVRFIGIDTPETIDPRKPVQCFGKEASQKTKELLTGKSISLEFDPVVGERDKYNRLLAYVWEQGKLINLSLIEEGYAHEYTYRSQAYKYQNDFKQAELRAREGEVGLWSPKTCSGTTK